MTEKINEVDAPKAFISYSWTSTEHQEWVLKLAEELVENGIHVVFDRWDLRENDDKYAFMEQAVTNRQVKKVIMICDRQYQEKADKREGGVGTETQIVSSEVYAKVKSDEDKKHKFCAVISERDEHGNPFVPAYLKSRIHIDMSTDDLRDHNFDQLVRWIFDKPLAKRPALGSPPSHLFEDDILSLRTSSIARLATSSIKQNKPNAFGIFRDYLDVLATNLEELRLEPIDGQNFDDQILESIESFLPYLNEFLTLVKSICRYSKDGDFINELGTFLERLIPYLFPPTQSVYYIDIYTSRQEVSADNYRFVIYELFVSTIAVLLNSQKFDWAEMLLAKQYYSEKALYEGREERLFSYLILRQTMRFDGVRAKRLTNNEPIIAGLLNEHSKSLNIGFIDIIQADLILYLRDEILNLRDGRWIPYSLVYLNYSQLELFKRSESEGFWESFKGVLGLGTKEQLGSLFDAFEKGEREIVRFGMFDEFNLREATNFERLATRT